MIESSKVIKNAIYLALSDTKARYRKSVIGPLWLTLTNLIGILGLGLVWGSLMQENLSEFIPQLAVGLVCWNLISGVLLDASNVFVRQSSMIRNIATPYWFFSMRGFAKHIINLFHNFLIMLGIAIYCKLEINSGIVFLPIGLLLLILNLYWIYHGLALLGARFRDVELMMASFVPFLFFVSPVLFRVEKITGLSWFFALNPLTYMIESVRMPYLGLSINLKVYAILALILIMGGGLTYFLNKRIGKRLVYWV